FFQAEDGIRDFHVTGVQTCALPICYEGHPAAVRMGDMLVTSGIAATYGDHAAVPTDPVSPMTTSAAERQMERIIDSLEEMCATEIGRASCRERGEVEAVGVG